mmetsp:Transcript_92109/g.176476  ORF Transcript_92109/g.176476 Transcript_92109/m.176476 type:complete len:110 (+) Transcript_92109:1504-1833(+)
MLLESLPVQSWLEAAGYSVLQVLPPAPDYDAVLEKNFQRLTSSHPRSPGTSEVRAEPKGLERRVRDVAQNQREEVFLCHCVKSCSHTHPATLLAWAAPMHLEQPLKFAS